MALIDIDDEIYEQWKLFYEKQNKIDYPSLKNFTTKQIRRIMEKEWEV